MARTIGRRAVFFAVLALVGLLMVIPTPDDFRDAAWFVVIVAGFWSVLFTIEDLTAPTYPRRRPEDAPVESPFAPPPPPGRR